MNDDIYVIGGFEAAGISDKVEVYSIINNSWRPAKHLPLLLHHAAAVAYNGKIYVIGGYHSGWTPSDLAFAYDPDKEEWQNLAKLSTARGALTAQVIAGKIYAIGGAAGRVFGTNEEYDIATDIWKTRKEMPTAREHLASGVAYGKIYAIGGRQGFGNNLDANEEYDPVADSWTTKTVMPSARGGIAGAVASNRIYVFGGETFTHTFNNNEVYDPVTDAWQSEEKMPTARHGLGVVAIGSRIYVIGGGPTPGLSYTGKNEVFVGT